MKLKTQYQAMSEKQKYLSRDIRKVIIEMLKNRGISVTRDLVEDIVDLVLVESTDIYARSVDAQLQSIISKLVK